MMRPSGNWSKPIGSLRFGGAEIFVCWKFLVTVAPQSLVAALLCPAAQAIAPFRCVCRLALNAASEVPRPV